MAIATPTPLPNRSGAGMPHAGRRCRIGCAGSFLQGGADVSIFRGVRSGLGALLLLLSPCAVAQSVPADRSPRIGATPSARVCVTAEIAGASAGQIDCATQALQDAARTAQSQARAGFDPPVVDARSSDIRTGVASQSATRQRLGNAFGVSVHPQRPARVPPAPRGGTVP